MLAKSLFVALLLHAPLCAASVPPGWDLWPGDGEPGNRGMSTYGVRLTVGFNCDGDEATVFLRDHRSSSSFQRSSVNWHVFSVRASTDALGLPVSFPWFVDAREQTLPGSLRRSGQVLYFTLDPLALYLADWLVLGVLLEPDDPVVEAIDVRALEELAPKHWPDCDWPR